MKFKELFLFFIFLSFSSYGAQKKQNLSSLKEKIQKHSNDVYKIGAQIQSIEEKLGEKNNDYLLQVQKMSTLESKIEILKGNLRKQEVSILNEQKKLKKIAEKLIIEKLDSDSDISMLKERLYLAAIENKKRALAHNMDKLKVLKNDIELYQKRLSEYTLVSEELHGLLVTLEENKKKLSSNYLKNIKSKSNLEKKLDVIIAEEKYKNKKIVKVESQKLGIDLKYPLKNYLSLLKSKKGITFVYKEVLPIFATGEGKVVYTGDLATYGKVVIIDHGHDLRSVFLGDMSIKVKKGDFLNKDAIVGYTDTLAGVQKNFYFELRRRNKAQNTFELMAQNNISKNI